MPLGLKRSRCLGELQLLEGFQSLLPGPIQTLFQDQNGSLEVIAAVHGSAGESRVGEVIDIGDAASLLLNFDLLVEIVHHTAEVGDHKFEIAHLLPLFFIFEALIVMSIGFAH